MFTGIIQSIGRITSLTPVAAGSRIVIEASELAPKLALGDSVAVNGTCTTVTALTPASFSADISTETKSKTTFARLRTGDYVNLELTLKYSDHLGGHMVSGHVDCVGSISELVRQADFAALTIAYPTEFAHLVIPKGSIAIDGMSLTVADLTDQSVTVALIPHTIDQTILKYKTPGDPVNLEFDLVGKYLYRFYTLKKDRDPAAADAKLLDTLYKAGFIS